MEKADSDRINALGEAARTIMDGTGLTASVNNYEHFLAQLFERVSAGGGSYLALDALLLTWAKHLRLALATSPQPNLWDGVDPKAEVRVPWWVVKLIVGAWSRFKNPDLLDDGKRPTLGQAFEVEQKGQGKRPLPVIDRERARNFERALLVAAEFLRLRKLDAALLSIEIDYGFARSQLLENWGEHGEAALAALGGTRTSRG
jgi:hypothetical protein